MFSYDIVNGLGEKESRTDETFESYLVTIHWFVVRIMIVFAQGPRLRSNRDMFIVDLTATDPDHTSTPAEIFGEDRRSTAESLTQVGNEIKDISILPYRVS